MSTLQKSPLTLFLTSLGLLFLFLLGTYFWPKQTKPSEELTVFSKARALPPFQMNPHFTETDFKHHWTLLYFGFTHCSDVCPNTLSTLNTVYQGLHTNFPELQVVFVTVDPEHENAPLVQHYASLFNPNFIGLSGTKTQMTRFNSIFGIFAEATPTTLNHSSSIFLINPKGQWSAIFPYGLSAKEIQTNFKLLTENKTNA